MPGILFTGFPNIPVAYSDRPSETQRTSRGKPRLLSAHDCQIYLGQPFDGYRTLSCVADSSRPPPASSACPLPDRYGAYLFVNPRFCLRLPSGTYYFQYPCPRLSFGSVSLDMDFAEYLCQNTSAAPISSRTSPAHNQPFNVTGYHDAEKTFQGHWHYYH